MFRCNQCKLTNAGTAQLYPAGSLNPDYYVLGDISTKEDGESGVVFDIRNQSANYLINMLGTVGITGNNATLFKLVRCTENGSIPVDDQCRQVCGIHAMMDIFKKKPKVIISLGANVTKYLLGDRFKNISTSRGKFYEVLINGETFKVLPTFSPNYVVNSKSMEVAETFLKDLQYAVSFVNGDLIDLTQKDLQVALNYEQFKSYFDKNLSSCDFPAYDIETNAVDARSEGARIVGFSLAPNGSTGVYVVRESLEYKMPEEDWKSIVNHTVDYFNRSKLLVHNCMYEIPYTKNEWDFLIENFEDTLIKSKLMLGGKIGAGLKDQAIRNLGYPDWDSDLGTYISGIRSVRDNLKPTPAGNSRWDFDELLTKSLPQMLSMYFESESSLDKRSTAVRDGILNIMKVCKSYYEPSELNTIYDLIKSEILALISSDHTGLPPYSTVPLKVIAKYGAMDAVATKDLDKYLTDKMTSESNELGVDLFKGYKYWKGHFTVATHMEMSGLYWNDDIANHECEWYADTCMQSAKNMIFSGYLDQYLIDNNTWRLRDYIREECLDEVQQVLGDFSLQKSGIKLADGTRITNKNILSAMDKATNGMYSQSKRDVILKLVEEEINSAKHYTDLKGIFNPGSPKAENKQLLCDILVSDEVRLAYLMSQVQSAVESPDFDLSKIPLPDRELYKVVADDVLINHKVEEYNELSKSDEDDQEILDRMGELLNDLDDYINDDEDDDQGSSKVKLNKIASTETYKKFVDILLNKGYTWRSTDTQMMIGLALNYKLEDVKEPSLIELNSYYVLLGIDVEDPSTWTDKYNFLYNFRMWKKCNKMITSYITGRKVGRGAVAVVDKESFDRGDTLSRRKRYYYDKDPSLFDPTKEVYVMQSNFKVCNAETGR